MTRDEAERVERLLKAQFPGADIDVERIFGGLRMRIYTSGSTMCAVLSSADSAVLAALIRRSDTQ